MTLTSRDDIVLRSANVIRKLAELVNDPKMRCQAMSRPRER
jgi:uncharacterized protein (UPF0147 family)